MQLSHRQYTRYCLGFSDRMGDITKSNVANCIQTGYYTAYYIWAKHAQKPNKLINKLYEDDTVYEKEESVGIAKSIQELNKTLGISK